MCSTQYKYASYNFIMSRELTPGTSQVPGHDARPNNKNVQVLHEKVQWVFTYEYIYLSLIK